MLKVAAFQKDISFYFWLIFLGDKYHFLCVTLRQAISYLFLELPLWIFLCDNCIRPIIQCCGASHFQIPTHRYALLFLLVLAIVYLFHKCDMLDPPFINQLIVFTLMCYAAF
jgi:hypothetical protein